jgi:hypothetical protein
MTESAVRSPGAQRKKRKHHRFIAMDALERGGFLDDCLATACNDCASGEVTPEELKRACARQACGIRIEMQSVMS